MGAGRLKRRSFTALPGVEGDPLRSRFAEELTEELDEAVEVEPTIVPLSAVVEVAERAGLSWRRLLRGGAPTAAPSERRSNSCQKAYGTS